VLIVASLAYYESFGLAFEAGLCKSHSHCSEDSLAIALGGHCVPQMACKEHNVRIPSGGLTSVGWLLGFVDKSFIFGFRNISESENPLSQFLRISFIICRNHSLLWVCFENLKELVVLMKEPAKNQWFS
jgi:hypothetical protein